ncbi:hypothetical protein [Leptospira noguchii]|uniref:hypothetical protein n=1 Tax=Leptospira noguchii TaxID=28182 RepID=UPI0003284775|nr:hypothetical protein [Leptospira noguchii]EMS84720.1 hypothetical protein LEP1GSC073_1777 [Leptospira noguchii str. Cascata]
MTRERPNDEFPDFIVQSLITALRIRHYQRVKWEEKRKKDLNKKRTWYQSYYINKQKLQRIYYKKRNVYRSEEDLWKKVIVYQKIKLKRRYDLYVAWRNAENHILRKMNERRFSKQIEAIWNLVAKNQVQKLKRRKVERTPAILDPDLFMKRQRSKLRLLYQRKSKNQEEADWEFAATAQTIKMNRLINKKSWNAVCLEQVDKMKRRRGEKGS